MLRCSKISRFVSGASLLLYLLVSPLHFIQHLGGHNLHEDSGTMGKPVHSESFFVPAGYENAGTWEENPGSSCPDDYPLDSRTYHSCHCSMLQFTLQQKYENFIPLAVNELISISLEMSNTQFYPFGIKPPPRLS